MSCHVCHISFIKLLTTEEVIDKYIYDVHVAKVTFLYQLSSKQHLLSYVGNIVYNKVEVNQRKIKD